MKVKVTYTFEPEPEEADSRHRMGITSEAYEKLTSKLMDLGAEDIEIEKETS